ncbi:MAG: sugar phosphate isomerase/epimerase [Armatimonadetes bacterium]|nr:sugar phosphate isomerase/epimerase [Armatimonadota bacterium]
MRLGYYTAGTPAALDALAEKLDIYGLSAVWPSLDGLSDEECVALGERARALGIVLGEAGMWENILTADPELRDQRIRKTRDLLRKADLAGVKCVVTLAGSMDPSGRSLAPDARNYTEACKRELREVVLRILDGLALKRVRYGIEPWHNTFFYQPEEIREFIDRVGHPAFGLHLDQMNMVSQASYHNTTELINKTFRLLADRAWSVHLKDIRCDPGHMFLKWDEVRIGDGVMDYETYLRRLADLPADTPCFCEHFKSEGDYAICFARLHHLAKKADVRFLCRGEASG